METVKINKSRDVAIDMMKGIAILLMLYYHLSSDFRPIIYSFHMPLFFILSGYFAKEVKDSGELLSATGRNVQRLLLPYLVTSCILIAVGAAKLLLSGSPDSFIESIQRFFWSGADIKYTDYGMIAAGPLWFLVALFWTRELFSLLQIGSVKLRCTYQSSLWFLLVASVLISVVAVIIHPLVQPVPLCLFQGCEALVFYAVGYCAKRGLFPRWSYFVALACWPAAIVWGGVDMMFCYLKIYPLSVIGACGGTYAVYFICKWVSSFCAGHGSLFKIAPAPLAWCGRFSLAILCMHSIDMLSDTYLRLMNALPFSFGEWGTIGFRLAFSIILAAVIVHMPGLKKVFD